MFGNFSYRSGFCGQTEFYTHKGFCIRRDFKQRDFEQRDSLAEGILYPGGGILRKGILYKKGF